MSVLVFYSDPILGSIRPRSHPTRQPYTITEELTAIVGHEEDEGEEQGAPGSNGP